MAKSLTGLGNGFFDMLSRVQAIKQNRQKFEKNMCIKT